MLLPHSMDSISSKPPTSNPAGATLALVDLATRAATDLPIPYSHFGGQLAVAEASLGVPCLPPFLLWQLHLCWDARTPLGEQHAQLKPTGTIDSLFAGAACMQSADGGITLAAVAGSSLAPTVAIRAASPSGAAGLAAAVAQPEVVARSTESTVSRAVGTDVCLPLSYCHRNTHRGGGAARGGGTVRGEHGEQGCGRWRLFTMA